MGVLGELKVKVVDGVKDFLIESKQLPVLFRNLDQKWDIGTDFVALSDPIQDQKY